MRNDCRLAHIGEPYQPHISQKLQFQGNPPFLSRIAVFRKCGSRGDGGSIILEADNNLRTLIDFRYNTHYKADRGKHGQGSSMRPSSTFTIPKFGTMVVK